MDDEELSCEGLQSILIDWQGGFVGSVANDLMWAIYPFLEANSGKQVSFFYFLKKLKTFDNSFLIFHMNNIPISTYLGSNVLNSSGILS